MSTPPTFGHMNEAGMELLAEPELHSCPLCDRQNPGHPGRKHCEYCLEEATLDEGAGLNELCCCRDGR